MSATPNVAPSSDTPHQRHGTSLDDASRAAVEVHPEVTPTLVTPPPLAPPPAPARKPPTVVSAGKQMALKDSGKPKTTTSRKSRASSGAAPAPGYAIPTDKLENFLLPCFISINITLIAIGCKYYGDCPGEPMIPVYVVVSGVSGVSFDMSRVVDRVTMFLFGYSSRASPVIALFIFVWFGYGNILIGATKSRSNLIVPDQNYCNPRIYWLTVWYIMFMWVLIIVSLAYYVNVWYC